MSLVRRSAPAIPQEPELPRFSVQYSPEFVQRARTNLHLADILKFNPSVRLLYATDEADALDFFAAVNRRFYRLALKPDDLVIRRV